MDARQQNLQKLCRQYLSQLKGVAEKFGLGGFVGKMIDDNKTEKCKATEEEVKLLARAVDDERVSRKDVPKMLGKSYRQCNDDEDFESIEKLKHVGIYSKVSVLLFAAEHKKQKQ